MSTLVQAFNVRKGHRRAVRVRRVRPNRKRDGGSKLPLDSPDDTLELAHPRELPERFLTPKAHRAAIYSASHAKLGITPDSTLETQWGELPSELVELVASHLHPRDVVRLRCVSSGWRADVPPYQLSRTRMTRDHRDLHFDPNLAEGQK